VHRGFIKELEMYLDKGLITDKRALQREKLRLCAKYGLDRVPKDAEILEALSGRYVEVLRTKRVRSLSGVAVVAAMTSPHPCPHGRCIYCPGGPEYNTPQSYTGREPAAMRASQNQFDPYRQVKARIEQLELNGHSTDKIDMIIMGGTFTSRPLDYQRWFVQRCLDAMNGMDSSSLEEAQETNQYGWHRCIGMTVETRPDWFRKEHASECMRMGFTRVELGVQTVFDHVLKAVERGHGVSEVVEATRVAKDAGFKVCYHMMPGLPGTTPEMDLKAFRKIFEDPDFRPDMLKIYPTLVMEGTRLHDLWRSGEYRELTTEDAVELLADVKAIVPPWVRIQRIQRDVPVGLITAGVKKSNLRQLVQDRLAETGWKCRCIRCREAGLQQLKGAALDWSSTELHVTEYTASTGREYFLSFEDSSGILAAYLRLRIPGNPWNAPVEHAGIVRELKVFGLSLPLGGRHEEAVQHRGLGRRLMQEAEGVARSHGIPYLLVNSGIGARQYYEDMGYSRMGVYMGRRL